MCAHARSLQLSVELQERRALLLLLAARLGLFGGNRLLDDLHLGSSLLLGLLSSLLKLLLLFKRGQGRGQKMKENWRQKNMGRDEKEKKEEEEGECEALHRRTLCD